MAKSVYVCDQDADVAIKTMMAAVVGTAVVPAHVNWALTASAMGAGAVAIGKCYGVQLTKDEGWKFVKQFVLSAGMWFLSMNVGSKILSMLMSQLDLVMPLVQPLMPRHLLHLLGLSVQRQRHTSETSISVNQSLRKKSLARFSARHSETKRTSR